MIFRFFADWVAFNGRILKIGVWLISTPQASRNDFFLNVLEKTHKKSKNSVELRRKHVNSMKIALNTLGLGFFWVFFEYIFRLHALLTIKHYHQVFGQTHTHATKSDRK